jgi:branched-chain amino acid transport system permease protein
MRERGMVRDALLVAVPLVLALAGLPLIYSNTLLLFNFIMFLTLAQGLNLIYGFTGFLPFGYVGFFGTGAYGFALAVMHLHFPPLAALAVGGSAALVLAVILTPLMRLDGAYFAIANLAAAQAVYQVVSNPALETITKGPYGVTLPQVYAPGASYAAALAILAGTLGVVIWLRNSGFGLALRATREDPISAAMAGFPVVRGRVIAWLISALIAVLTGGVFAWHVSVFYPEAAFDFSIGIFAIVFTLFGGSATLLGPVLGVLILYGLYNAIGITVPQYFQLIYGVLIMGFALFLPNGLISLLTRRGIHVP